MSASRLRKRLTLAPQAKGWDPVRAWSFVRASRAYRAAWERCPSRQPGLPERAPFPVRLRTPVDSAAMAWGMLAWEDPRADRPLAPFWADAGVFDGRASPGAPPLARLAAEGGADLSGLRLGDGSLVLRIERGGRSVLVRFPAGEDFPADAGLRLLLVREVSAIDDLWPDARSPRPGRVQGVAGTASFCWPWNARPTGSRGAISRCASGSRSMSSRSTTPAAGWRRGSSAGIPGQGRS